MQNPTLIYIPDISGFTEFVNTTAIEHSQHIISELLEIIINANKLNFTISEIEGDAVLFYKKDNLPNVVDIIEQSKEMFLLFHRHLYEIERTNVCQCGACKTVSSLSLKFITHLGDIKEVRVKQFNKLIGSDLILAHRLLKNSIESNEYLLLSDKYYESFSSPIEFDDWILIESSSEEIDKFGVVSTKYINFKPLLEQVPQFIKENMPKSYTRKPDIFTSIDAPMLLVHDKLTDTNAKYEYAKGVKKIVTNDKINRVNTSHTCVFDNLEIHFVTKNNTVENDKIAYSEEAELKVGFRFITDYRLQENNGKTDLSVFLIKSHQENNTSESLYKKLKNYLFLKFIIYNNKKGIKLFKDYCEKFYKESLVK